MTDLKAWALVATVNHTQKRLGRYGHKGRIEVFVTIQDGLRSYYPATMCTRRRLSTDGEAVDAAIIRRIGHSEEFKFGLWKYDSSGSKSKANERQKKFNDDDLPRQKTESRFGGDRPPPTGKIKDGAKTGPGRCS